MKKAFILLLFLVTALHACTPRTAVIIPDSNAGAPDTLLVRTDRLIRQ